MNKHISIFSGDLFFFTLSSGDTDAVIPVTSTRYSIDALKLPTVTPWRAWYDDDGEVGASS
jgi:serine carboxypeptidase-like clade 2